MSKSRKLAALTIILVILLFSNHNLFAQYEEGEDPLYIPEKKLFSAGLVGGVNQAQVDGDYFAGYYKTGANVGGIVYANISKHVSLSMEILYSQKGSMSNGPQISPGNSKIIITNYGINVNYAEVPFMINYWDTHKSNIGTGFSVSRLVSSRELLNVDSFNQVSSIDLNQNYPFKKTGLDFLIGGNLHLVKGLYLNLRFQYSIVPIRTQLPPADYARADQYNNLWVIRAMYLFR